MILGALIGVVLIGRNLSARLIALALITPVLSASLLGWFAGNPFNGAVSLALGIALCCGNSEMARRWPTQWPGGKMRSRAGFFPWVGRRSVN